MDESVMLLDTKLAYTKQKLVILEEAIDEKTKQGISIKALYDATVGDLIYQRNKLFYRCQYLNKEIAMAKEAEEKGALMTESLMVQRLKSFQEKNEEKLEKYRRNVEASKKYVQAEDLSINEIGLIHDYYINVIAKIHPDVHYYTPPLNISIFKRAQMAFITNDIAALKNIHDTTTDNREDLSVREKQVLLDKMEYLIQKKTIKLEWIPLRAPYDKKNIINDPHEMEKEKAKINHEIQQFEMIQKQLETISERIVFMADA